MSPRFLLYFLLGGGIVCLVTFVAGQARGLLAAFLATLPVMTLITLVTVSIEAGEAAVLAYAWGLVIMLFPWLAYIFAVILLAPRWGTYPALAVGVAAYLVFALAILHFRRGA